MELFHVEVGFVPGQSCREETTPILAQSRRSDDLLSSKSSLPRDSLASESSTSLRLADQSSEYKRLDPSFDGTPANHDDIRRHSEYYSSRNAKISGARSSQDISANQATVEKSHSATKMTLAELARTSPTEKEPESASPECTSLSSVSLPSELLTLTPNVIREAADSLVTDAFDHSLARHSEFYHASRRVSSKQQPLSQSCGERSLAPKDTRGSTLLDLTQKQSSNGPEKMKKGRKNSKASCFIEDEDNLVRHSIYYSTSSSVHGVSSQERRLRNKLNARRHLMHDDLQPERPTQAAPLVHSHAVMSKIIKTK